MEKKQNVELLLAPTDFKELMRVYNSDLIENPIVLYHSETHEFSAHLDIKIQNVLLRMRSYNITEDDYKTALFVGFKKI